MTNNEEDTRLEQILTGLPKSLPAKLEYTSHWQETIPKCEAVREVGEKVRYRTVQTTYDISTGIFTVSIDSDENLYHTINVKNIKTNTPVTVWDLHLGATLDILGRPTTLQSCSRKTAFWNEYWANILYPLRKSAEVELQKYNTVRLPPWIRREQKMVPGHTNLARLMGQLHVLVTVLKAYRPRLASEFSIPSAMHEIGALPEEASSAMCEAFKNSVRLTKEIEPVLKDENLDDVDESEETKKSSKRYQPRSSALYFSMDELDINTDNVDKKQFVNSGYNSD